MRVERSSGSLGGVFLALVVPVLATSSFACAAAPAPVPAATAVAAESPAPTAASPAPADEESDDGEGRTGTVPAPTTTAAAEEGTRRRARSGDPVRQELIVIDPGTSQTRPDPGELARRTAAGTRGSPPRVTNENLGDYARSGQVTVAGPSAAAAPVQEAAAEEAAVARLDEAYWRRSAREIREEWRRTLDEIVSLEESAADLRWRFYAEDDPWVRDGQVKPEWDRVLDRLSEARRALADYPRQLEELTERGREEGALPGWLREGIELEPRDEELPEADRDPAEPVEPTTMDEGSRRDSGGAA